MTTLAPKYHNGRPQELLREWRIGQALLVTDRVIEHGENPLIARVATVEGNTLTITGPDERRKIPLDCDLLPGAELRSGNGILDAAWRLARRDVEANFYAGGAYAGKFFRHDGTWVRDTSYSVLMGLALFYPEKSAEILRGLLNHATGELKQEQYAECWEGHPYTMTDNTVWVLAAHELAIVTGDPTVLHEGAAYAIATIERMLRERLNERLGLFVGNSSFFDGHNGYPVGLTGNGLCSLSTNMLCLRAMAILAELEVVGDPTRARLRQLHHQLVRAIDEHLWLEMKQFYAQFCHAMNYREERYETLGNLLAAADLRTPHARAIEILNRIPLGTHGVESIHPFYDQRTVYHTGAVWPFECGMAIWALNQRDAGAPRAPVEITTLIGHLIRTACIEGNFMELLDASTGRGLYSEQQLWSASAMLAAVGHGLLGMRFEKNCIRFNPRMLPILHDDPLEVRGITLRGRTCDISVHCGQVFVDGEALKDNCLITTDYRPVMEREAFLIDRILPLPTVRMDEPVMAELPNGLAWGLDRQEIVVYPCDQQIGSYDLHVWLQNNLAHEMTVTIDAECAENLIITPAHQQVTVGAGKKVTCRIAVGFDEPPTWLDRAAVKLTLQDHPVCEIGVRRVLSLAGDWRIKPMFKNLSHRFERHFDEYDPHQLLHAPMPAEFRLGALTGMLWYARQFVVPESWRGRRLIFYAGAMADRDAVYINGNLIGQSGVVGSALGLPRRYCIAPDMIKPGESNLIVVATDNYRGRQTGICGGPLFVSPQDEFEWALATSSKMMADHTV